MPGTEVENVFSISTSLDSSLLKIQNWQSYSRATKLWETVSMLMKSEMKIVFWFPYLKKTKIANRPKIPVMRGEGKTGSGANQSKMALVWSRRDTCLRGAVFSGIVTPTAIRSLPVPWPRSFKEMGWIFFFTVSVLLF